MHVSTWRVSEPMVPLRLFGNRAFAVGNATTFLRTGAIFAAGFLITQEFQLARGYSPGSPHSPITLTGTRLEPAITLGTCVLISYPSHPCLRHRDTPARWTSDVGIKAGINRSRLRTQMR